MGSSRCSADLGKFLKIYMSGLNWAWRPGEHSHSTGMRRMENCIKSTGPSHSQVALRLSSLYEEGATVHSSIATALRNPDAAWHVATWLPPVAPKILTALPPAAAGAGRPRVGSVTHRAAPPPASETVWRTRLLSGPRGARPDPVAHGAPSVLAACAWGDGIPRTSRPPVLEDPRTPPAAGAPAGAPRGGGRARRGG